MLLFDRVIYYVREDLDDQVQVDVGALHQVAVVVVRLAVRNKLPEPIANFAVDYHLRGIRLGLVPDIL